MAHHGRSGRRRPTRSTMARRRRSVGLSTTAGAFLAFGLGPLGAPAAHADPFTDLIDLIISPVTNSLTNLDPLATLDPSTLDLGTLSLGGLESSLALPTNPLAALDLSAEPAAAAAASSDSAANFNEFIHQPLH